MSGRPRAGSLVATIPILLTNESRSAILHSGDFQSAVMHDEQLFHLTRIGSAFTSTAIPSELFGMQDNLALASEGFIGDAVASLSIPGGLGEVGTAAYTRSVPSPKSMR